MTRQSWADFLLHYYVCQSCGVVDRDDNRMIVGYACPRCGTPGEGGRSYFDITVGAIADLIAEFYLLPDPDLGLPTSPLPPPPESHRLAILVFFCTLGEILLQHFLERCMFNLNLPAEIRRRLLQDNLFIRQRINRLFPAVLAGTTWKQAVKVAAERSRDDFQSTVDFYIEANDKRNQLLHVGNKWAVPPDMAKQCFDHTAALIRLFVELHNACLAKPVPAEKL